MTMKKEDMEKIINSLSKEEKRVLNNISKLLTELRRFKLLRHGSVFNKRLSEIKKDQAKNLDDLKLIYCSVNKFSLIDMKKLLNKFGSNYAKSVIENISEVEKLLKNKSMLK